ncbi:Uncharacterised protein [Pseudomonas putida]|nr:Uncharacterised protein [Pseudomonas putida]CAB5527048.1 Uncharacterised protein [Pseudomonas putida]CAB5569321.1 Uncharacterised protein [Pseudomonas putida]CAB5589454.1 Uncharacterised protein [Pseudomonas putida]CAB5650705.1 Uncharacterised protein [Pseudomonas putida]
MKVRANNKKNKNGLVGNEAVAWDFYGGYLTSLSKEATCGRRKV